MANYGPYPGPPSQPWHEQDRQSTDEYGQPVDPWGDQDQTGGSGHWAGGQPSAPPGGPGAPSTWHSDVGQTPAPHHAGGSAPFGAPPAGWTAPDVDSVWAAPVADPSWSSSAPDPMPKGRGSRAFVAVLVALAVLVFGAAAIGIYLLGREQPSTGARSPGTVQTEGPGNKASTSPEPAPTTTAAEPSTDARFVTAGQCVRNEGSEAAPRLTITTCAPQAYEVLARYNGATTGAPDAKAKCAQVQRYTNFYYFNSELDDLDFVLCLRRR